MSPAVPAASVRASLTHERVLAALVGLELVAFAVLGTNFMSAGNAAEVVRASVEIGLLALALTPVIVTGGIDLSVGSLLGLSAVTMGAAFRDGALPIGIAVLVGLGVGLAGGALNAVLIARFRIPALIVTLGTYSLFRGLAEGLTGGVRNYSEFPAGFLFVGQGSWAGVPAQLPILAVAAVGFALLLHRLPASRALRAIGFATEGARHAGIAVGRHLAFVYLCSGACAGVAALVYVARLGQAKADAGTGFELVAITAVVLGGTSIFGGTGSVHGTLLGLVALSLLHNGLILADLPSELGGILTGVLLLGAIGARTLLERKP